MEFCLLAIELLLPVLDNGTNNRGKRSGSSNENENKSQIVCPLHLIGSFGWQSAKEFFNWI